MNIVNRSIPVWGMLALLSVPAMAQNADDAEQIEEVVVIGKQLSSAKDLVQERMDKPVVIDYIGAEQIARVGDTTVAAALRRVPGLTLAQEKFVYVRGLGERYSSSLVNLAEVPSPDLTRNVLPLDLFPSSIVEALGVQKAYSPDMPAAFGGGNIDIQTRGVPDAPVLTFEVGSGWNSDSDDDGVEYEGGNDDRWGTDDGTRELPGELRNALAKFRGDLSPASIFNGLRRDGGTPTFAEAEAVNRQIATSLYRDIDFNTKELEPDVNAEVALGNRWYFGEADQLEVGGIAVGGYEREWRNRERTARSVNDPDLNFQNASRTIDQVTVTGVANFAARWTDDHAIETSTIYLRNTEDEAVLTTGFGLNFTANDGRQFRNYAIRYEERELLVNQVSGTHTLGDATERLLDSLGLGFLPTEALAGLRFHWFVSDSEANTDIPNEVLITAEDTVDPVTHELISTRVRNSSSAADYRFTELDDDVRSSGWSLALPLVVGDFDVEVSGGQDYTRKGRQYLQNQFFLGSTRATPEDLAGTAGPVFADENILDPDNGFLINTGGIGTESYLAGQITDAAFGKLDVTWRDTWRVSGGVRWEQFQQVSVPIDILEYDVSIGQVPLTNDELADATFLEDAYYPALAVTWMVPDFWAEQFQLRFGWGRTVARPDLREISQAIYIDPLTEARVRGNPDISTSDLINYDVRAEWFFANGDNFTVSLFYKEIDDPIETIQQDASDNDLAFTFLNGESGEIYGVEVEWLKSLGFAGRWLGDWMDTLFVGGNVTLSDSEIEIGDIAVDLTNNERPMTQHSDWMLNLQLGFDSPNGAHSASLVYNAFGERIFYGGKEGAPDALEQPFHSLDVVYTWFVTENLSLKLKMQNLLGEETEIEAGGVTIFEQTVGSTASVDFKWQF